MNSLLSLFDSILVPILEYWLSDDDIGHLDSAVCNWHLRIHFLASLNKCRLEYFNVMMAYINNFYDWIALRGMGLRRLSLKDYSLLTCSNSLRYILSVTKRFDFIQISCGSTLTQLMHDFGFTVVSCKFTECSTDADVIEVLKHCPSLEMLDVSACSEVTNDVCCAICIHCPELRRLIASELLDIGGIIQSCHHLQKIRCAVSDEVVDALHEGLVSIKFHNEISAVNLRHAAQKCCNLTSINVFGNNLSDDSVVALASQCRKLSYLAITSSSLTDVSFEAIAVHCKDLMHLKMSATKATDKGILVIATHLMKLTELSLSKSYYITNESMMSIGMHCKQLDRLIIYSCSRLTLEGLEYCLNGCPSLRYLSVSKPLMELAYRMLAVDLKCISVRPSAKNYIEITNYRLGRHLWSSSLRITDLGNVLKQNANLTVIDIWELNISNEDVEAMVACCPLLTKVYFMDCSLLTAKVLTLMADAHQLQTIAIRGLTDVTVEAVQSLVEQRTSLVALSLPLCGGINDECLDLIAKHCADIRSLNVRSACQITSRGVRAVLKRCPRLDTLQLNDCIKVDADLFDGLEGRRMRSLSVKGCTITADEATAFSSRHGYIAEFQYDS